MRVCVCVCVFGTRRTNSMPCATCDLRMRDNQSSFSYQHCTDQYFLINGAGDGCHCIRNERNRVLPLTSRSSDETEGWSRAQAHTHTSNSLSEENRIGIEIEISQLIFLSSHFCSMITSISARCLLSKMDSR